MKKTTTLCLSLLCFASVAQAQQNDKSFRILEKQGDSYTEIVDGSTLNYTAADAEETPFGSQIKPALYIENTTGDHKALALSLNVTSLNEGADIRCCAAGACQSFGLGENVKYGNAPIDPKAIIDMGFEYIPKSDLNDDGDVICFDGAGSVVLRADVCEYTEEDTKWGTKKYTFGDVIGVGPQITINFNFNYTGIQDAQNPDNGIVKEVARYNGAGQRVNGPVKGLNIVKLANGKTVKQIYK